jgi:hypothetical protein
MPFLKEFIINDKTKIKLWKVIDRGVKYKGIK